MQPSTFTFIYKIMQNRQGKVVSKLRLVKLPGHEGSAFAATDVRKRFQQIFNELQV